MAIMRNKHLLNHLPHIYEIDDLLAFCRKHDKLYIYGCTEEQEYITKFMDMCGVSITGYAVTNIDSVDYDFCYRHLPVRRAEEVIYEEGTGIILGLSDKLYDQIIPYFRSIRFERYFQMTENTRIGIAEQMKPRSHEEMTFEISLADHCNLSCQMCDHFSQLSDEWFVSTDSFTRDMKNMGRIYDHKIGAITLVGGEPTLHSDICRLMAITREEFPEAQIIVLTNGTKLLDPSFSDLGNFWETCREQKINITVTVYPIKLDYVAIEKKALEYGVPICMSSNIHADQATRKPKISDKHTMDPKGQVPKAHCVHCLYFNKFNVVKDGKYYMCPVEAHIDILNKKYGLDMVYIKGDYLILDEVKDWHEFSVFSSSWIPFCRFCDQKNWRHDSVWKASSKMVEEYI